jgi:hypothetical protein
MTLMKVRVFQLLASCSLPLPADLENWLSWEPGLEAELCDFKGVQLLLVNLKLRPLRAAFMHAWRATVASTGVTGSLVYNAMAAASAVVLASKVLSTHGAPDWTGYSLWQRECNGQTSYHHGGLAFLRRWGLIIGGRARARARGQDPLRIAPLSDELEKSLARVLSADANEVVGGLHAVDTLQEWVQQIDEAVPAIKRLGLPGLTRRSGRNHMCHICGVCVEI